jgi:inward rectifier potassium channel
VIKKDKKVGYEKLVAILAPEKNFLGRGFQEDTYHYLVSLPWSLFLFWTLLFLLLITLLFGLSYYFSNTLRINHTDATHTLISIWDSLFFSIVTITTLGYGDIRVIGAGRVLAGLEVVTGLMFVGVFTALIFARLSRARIRIHFSKNIAFDEHEGIPALLFRVTNLRANDLVGVHIDFYFMKIIHLKDGTFTRRWYPLQLTPPDMPVFSFTWKVTHQIKKDSYFDGKYAEEIAKNEGIFLAILKGYDIDLATESMVYNVWAADCVIQGNLPDLLSKSKEGRPMYIPFEKLDEIIKREINVDIPKGKSAAV